MIQSQEVSTVMAVVNDVHSSSIQIRSEGDVCVCALVRPSPVCPDVLSEWVGANVCVINRFNGDTF